MAEFLQYHVAKVLPCSLLLVLGIVHTIHYWNVDHLYLDQARHLQFWPEIEKFLKICESQ